MKRTWSRHLETNILKCYNRATEYDRDLGVFWYTKAHEHAEILAERYSIELWQAAGVIAAISPGSNWGRNLVEADELIRAFVSHEPIPHVGAYGRRNVEKALHILRGESPLDVLPPTGPKVRAFFANILFPVTSADVTIDRHAKAIAYNYGSTTHRGASDDELSVVRVSEYNYIAWHYRKVAERLSLGPCQLQAICWVTWKRLRGNLDQGDLFI